MKIDLHCASGKIWALRTTFKDPNTVILYLTTKEIGYFNCKYTLPRPMAKSNSYKAKYKLIIYSPPLIFLCVWVVVVSCSRNVHSCQVYLWNTQLAVRCISVKWLFLYQLHFELLKSQIEPFIKTLFNYSSKVLRWFLSK